MTPSSRCWAARSAAHELPSASARRVAPRGAAVLVVVAGWLAWAAAVAAPCPELGPPEQFSTPEEFEYRCKLLEELKERGLDPGAPVMPKILAEMARSYSTVIELAGDVPLPKAALDYLLQELPDTARLVNHYEHSSYRVVFLEPNRSRFFATNNRSMQAEFTYIDSRVTEPESSHWMFETGRSKILLWTFAGSALLELGFVPQQQAASYTVHLHVFTDSWPFHLFFRSALFSGLMRSMFSNILDDVVGAVRRFVASDDAIATDDPDFPRELKARAGGSSS